MFNVDNDKKILISMDSSDEELPEATMDAADKVNLSLLPLYMKVRFIYNAYLLPNESKEIHEKHYAQFLSGFF